VSTPPTSRPTRTARQNARRRRADTTTCSSARAGPPAALLFPEVLRLPPPSGPMVSELTTIGTAMDWLLAVRHNIGPLILHAARCGARDAAWRLVDAMRKYHGLRGCTWRPAGSRIPDRTVGGDASPPQVGDETSSGVLVGDTDDGFGTRVPVGVRGQLGKVGLAVRISVPDLGVRCRGVNLVEQRPVRTPRVAGDPDQVRPARVIGQQVRQAGSDTATCRDPHNPPE